MGTLILFVIFIVSAFFAFNDDLGTTITTWAAVAMVVSCLALGGGGGGGGRYGHCAISGDC